MSLDAHRIPGETFTAIAEGNGGEAAARFLVAIQHSKHVLLLRRTVSLAAAAGHDEADAARLAYGHLSDIQERDPGAVSAVIGHPAVGAWAREVVRTLESAEHDAAASPAQLAAVAAAAAIRARLPFAAEIPVLDGSAMLPSLGRASASAGQLRVSGAGVTIDQATLPADLSAEDAGWQGLRRVSVRAGGQDIELLIDDLDPCRAPGAENIAGRLSAADAARWQSIVSDGWDLLERHHRAVAEEAAIMVRVLTPLHPLPDGYVSSTARHAFGAVMLSTPPDARSFALTIAHELQHAKLSALLDIIPMTHRDDGRVFYAPWREDPRPASGLLQGAYAFLGVAAFWRRQSKVADGEFAIAEFARWADGVRRVTDTLLQSGSLTRPGEVFVSGIDRTLRRWDAEPVPASAIAQAKLASDEHEERWRRRNSDLAALLG